MFTEKYKQGFSLIELMVVIAIIGIISAVSLASLSAIQKNTRDAQRQSDLRIIQGALQQYYADRNYFPDNLGTLLTAGGALTNCTGLSCTPTKTYLSNTPKDPISGTSYCYVAQYSVTDTTACTGPTSGKCHYYKLYAMLESSSPGTGICGSVNTYNFELTPL